MTTPGARLRDALATGVPLTVPGAANALTARIIQDAGFPAVYVTGAGVANTFLGVPDIGLLALPQLAAHVAAMREVVNVPLIVDADTGFGNAVNVWHTVRTLERAGADAIQLEDQRFPKRCGHFDGKSVIPAAEMAGKIRSALDARTDPDLVVIARTDARAVEGLSAACDRANAYHEAGADLVFVEAPRSVAEIETIGATVAAPKVLNLVEGGLTPQPADEDVRRLGYAVVLHANLALLATIRSVADVLRSLHDGDRRRPPIASWEQRQELVGKPWYEDLETRYGVET